MAEDFALDPTQQDTTLSTGPEAAPEALPTAQEVATTPERDYLDKKMTEYEKQKIALDARMQKMIDASERRNQLFDPKLMALASGLLRPTKTGGFGESLGYGLEEFNKAASEEEKSTLQNAKMRHELMKGALEENKKSIIEALAPKLFKVDKDGRFTGELDPAVAQKLVALTGDASVIQKVIEASKPQIGEIAPGGSTYDKRTGKIIATVPKEPTPSDLKKKEDELAKLKEELAKDPTNETLKANVKYHENELKKLDQLEFPDEVLTMLAQQALAGDTSVFVNVGRGTQGPNNLVRLRIKMNELMKANGMTPGDIAAKNAEFFGFKAGQRTLGTRSANLELAAQGFLNIVPIAQQASDNVSRSKFLPFGKVQIMFDENFNDPDVAQFAAANNGLVNTYARAISPTGVPTVSDKNHAREILAMAKNKESYDRAVLTLQKEIEAEQRAPKEVRSALRSEISGGAPEATKPTAKPKSGKHMLNGREIVPKGNQWVYKDTGEVAQ